MDTKIIPIQSAKEQQKIEEAAKILKNGGLVAIPTETVYGLAGSAFSADAAAAIYRAKGRPSDNPLIVHISEPEQLPDLIQGEIPPAAKLCIEHFWPGPFTVILPKSARIPEAVSGGLQTVAIRLPNHEIARAIISASKIPLAAPSANLSGAPSPTTAQAVIHDLNGRIDAIIAAGPCTVGVESTVVTFATDPPRLLRPGGITAEQLRKFVPNLIVDPAVLSQPEKDKPVASPGMKYKHYAPKANITLFVGNNKAFTHYCNAHRTVYDHALCFEEDLPGLTLSATSLGKSANAEEQAEQLFHALRKLDDLNRHHVLAHAPAQDGMGLAVYNRLIRAAGFKIIKGDAT